jgi:hypothetical protein
MGYDSFNGNEPMINNTPLALLKSDTAMAVKCQKAMNSALDRSDYARYDREAQVMDLAMARPSFAWDEFKRLCKAYGVDF